MTVRKPFDWEEPSLEHYIGARRLIRLWRMRREIEYRHAERQGKALEHWHSRTKQDQLRIDAERRRLHDRSLRELQLGRRPKADGTPAPSDAAEVGVDTKNEDGGKAAGA
eukprot:gene40538-59278_t